MPFAGQFDQRRQGDVLGIDLEEPPQFLAGLAAAEAVGAEDDVGSLALTPGPSPKGERDCVPTARSKARRR